MAKGKTIYKGQKTREKLSDDALLHQVGLIWNEFNCRKHFEKKMVRPNFQISKGERRLGYWRHYGRVLAISVNLLRYASWTDLKETILHEMAHQYVDEILGMVRGAHGFTWQMVAKRAGCPPMRLAREGIKMLSDGEEKKREQRREYLKKKKEEFERVGYPVKYMLVQFYYPKDERWVRGMVVCRATKTTSKYAMVAHEYKFATHRWWKISASELRVWEPKMTKELQEDIEIMKQTADEVEKNVNKKLNRRSKRGLGFPFGF